MKKIQFPVGMSVSSDFTSDAKEFMPGVGKVVGHCMVENEQVYICKFHNRLYVFKAHQIYEYVPY